MTATLEQVQAFVSKEDEGEKLALVNYIQDDGSLKELTGVIKVATVAGIGFKEKGKSGVELLELSKIEEIDTAPVKPKTISKKKQLPVPDNQVRAHLAYAHGISLKWCREASDADAAKFHNELDHTDLGHDHSKKKDEKAAENAGEATSA